MAIPIPSEFVNMLVIETSTKVTLNIGIGQILEDWKCLLENRSKIKIVVWCSDLAVPMDTGESTGFY